MQSQQWCNAIHTLLPALLQHSLTPAMRAGAISSKRAMMEERGGVLLRSHMSVATGNPIGGKIRPPLAAHRSSHGRSSVLRAVAYRPRLAEAEKSVAVRTLWGAAERTMQPADIFSTIRFLEAHTTPAERDIDPAVLNGTWRLQVGPPAHLRAAPCHSLQSHLMLRDRRSLRSMLRALLATPSEFAW